MMGFVDEEQVVQAEPKKDEDYAGRQKKALWIVYRPSVSAFAYCEQSQTVCSGSVLRKGPEPLTWTDHTEAEISAIPIWLENSLPTWHNVSWPWVARFLSPSVWVMGLWWPFGEFNWYSSLQQYEHLWTCLSCPLLPTLPHLTELTATFLILFFILIDWAQDTINAAEHSRLQMLFFVMVRVCHYRNTSLVKGWNFLGTKAWWCDKYWYF